MNPNSDAPFRLPPGLLGRGCRIDDGIPGIIVAVCERISGALEVEVVWWSGRERREMWMAPAEVRLDPPDAEPRQFGFDHG